MFLRSLSGGGIGSPELECGWCGRVHLCVNSNNYDQDDEEDGGSWRAYCEQEAKDHPDTVILDYEYDSSFASEVNGIMFVHGCPCNGLHRYEVFIWESRNTIRNYLKVRIEQEHQWAEQELTLNKLAGISK